MTSAWGMTCTASNVGQAGVAVEGVLPGGGGLRVGPDHNSLPPSLRSPEPTPIVNNEEQRALAPGKFLLPPTPNSPISQLLCEW